MLQNITVLTNVYNYVQLCLLKTSHATRLDTNTSTRDTFYVLKNLIDENAKTRFTS